jgi:hypothetical protein
MGKDYRRYRSGFMFSAQDLMLARYAFRLEGLRAFQLMRASRHAGHRIIGTRPNRH